jgi:hypothetical protein
VCAREYNEITGQDGRGNGNIAAFWVRNGIVGVKHYIFGESYSPDGLPQRLNTVPPPTPEEIELRRSERIFRAAMTAPGSPDKRQRRALRKMKGRD